MDDEPMDELARRLAAAYISYVMGVTMNTAYKNIGADKPGEYWRQLARRVSSEQADAMDSMFSGKPQP